MSQQSNAKRPWYSCRWGIVFWIAWLFIFVTIGDLVGLLVPAIEAAVERGTR